MAIRRRGSVQPYKSALLAGAIVLAARVAGAQDVGRRLAVAFPPGGWTVALEELRRNEADGRRR